MKPWPTWPVAVPAPKERVPLFLNQKQHRLMARLRREAPRLARLVAGDAIADYAHSAAALNELGALLARGKGTPHAVRQQRVIKGLGAAIARLPKR